jgi:hypothetical protein
MNDPAPSVQDHPIFRQQSGRCYIPQYHAGGKDYHLLRRGDITLHHAANYHRARVDAALGPTVASDQNLIGFSYIPAEISIYTKESFESNIALEFCPLPHYGINENAVQIQLFTHEHPVSGFFAL